MQRRLVKPASFSPFDTLLAASCALADRIFGPSHRLSHRVVSLSTLAFTSSSLNSGSQAILTHLMVLALALAAVVFALTSCAHPGGYHARSAQQLEQVGLYEKASAELERAASLEPENEEYQASITRLRGVLYNESLRVADERRGVDPAAEFAALNDADRWLPGNEKLTKRIRELDSEIEAEATLLVKSAGVPPFDDVSRLSRAAVLYSRAAWLRPDDAELGELARDLRRRATPERAAKLRLVCAPSVESICSSLRAGISSASFASRVNLVDASEDAMLIVSARMSVESVNDFDYERAVSSRYVERVDEEINSNYARMLEAVRAQENRVQQLAVTYAANGGLLWALIWRDARNDLTGLQNMLASTPPTILVPRYESYEYTEVGFRSRASVVGTAELVDQATGRTLWSDTIDGSVDAQLTLRASVRDSDESDPPRSDGVAHSDRRLRELLSVEASNELLSGLGEILSNFKLATAQYHREQNPSYAMERRLEEILAHRGGLIDGSAGDDSEWLKAIVGMNVMQVTKRTPRSARFSADVGSVSAPPSGPGPKHATVASSASIADAIESVQRAVVRIDAFKGLGSGFFISPGDRVLTNAHVVGGVSELVVIRTRGGGVHVGQVVASDTSRDLALLSAGISRTFIELGHDDAVRIGQEVIALGSPEGLSFSATRGIVSQLRQAGETRFIQHDAAINPGSSGGPLLDREGKALGINTIKLTESEGLGFAVTSGEIQEFLLAIPAASEARSAGPEEGLE